ncbi:MAG TPA: DUF6544 family protein, partial [Thermoanaerobaculia bacterium]|nr:DUF6544 family protein [Thermoanaerobaculia bacterium]
MSWIIAGLVLLALVATVALAGYRWRRESRRLMARLDPGNGPSGAPVLSAAELAGLPDPVARYLRAVLHEGQPIARHALVLHRGDFLLRPGENGWRPFTSSEHFAVQPPGFVWDARIRMVPALPGLDVLVRDSFVSGRGSMHGSVLGLVPVVAAEGTPEMAAGALYRYLAEAAWIPTAFLPRHGVVWTAIDESSAR